MKLTAIIRPAETRTLQAEAGDYESAKAQIEAPVPEGWQTLQVLTTPK
jgi:hypothetical protein